jgi:prepilin-type N-terminal cleavage/methylation domain-containing protein
MKIKTSLKAAFTLIEIMIVVAIIGLLASIAIPSFVKARQTAQKNACISNLNSIDGAKETWALESKKNNSDACTSADLIPYIKGNAMPQCPAGGSYTINAIGAKPTCSQSANGHSI